MFCLQVSFLYQTVGDHMETSFSVAAAEMGTSDLCNVGGIRHNFSLPSISPSASVLGGICGNILQFSIFLAIWDGRWRSSPSSRAWLFPCCRWDPKGIDLLSISDPASSA